MRAVLSARPSGRDDTIFGLGIDRLSGGDGNDSLFGMDSRNGMHNGVRQDLVEGGAGDAFITCDDTDTVDGGGGIDVLRIGTLGVARSINRIDLTDQPVTFDDGSNVTGLFLSIEGVQARATLVGDAGDNLLQGWWSRDDRLIGGRGRTTCSERGQRSVRLPLRPGERARRP
jgi:hypothetical protein